MRMQNKLELHNSSNPVNGQIRDARYSTPKFYKKVSPKDHYICSCPLCITIGLEWIVQQYDKFHNILIEDHNSKLIFDPFLEKEVRY
jgi:hypothetical protein